MTLQTANYSNFFETTLDGNVGASDTSITLSAAPTSDGTSNISAPFYLVIDPDSATNREVILVTASSGVTMSDVTRDVEGRHSPDISHADGITVRMAVVGEMFEDLHDRVNDIALTGDVTGTISSSTQDIATTVASGLDATKIADGSVTSTEFQYINTLTSNAQTQLDAKETKLNDLTGETVDVSADSIAFIDASDSNNSKKESIADFVSGIAGSGLTASNGQLTAGAGFELNSAKAFFALNG